MISTDPPDPDALAGALDTLHSLGAVDDAMNLTPRGQSMSQFPLDPLLSALLVSCARRGCLREGLTVASLLQVDNVYVHGAGSTQKCSGFFFVVFLFCFVLFCFVFFDLL
jgi:HrpA-like RNA helicase